MENIYYLTLLFVSILLVTYTIIPKIRNISLRFNLTDTPGVRSSHANTTPSFGGVAF
jgi:UDP-N-acetylmuramyl pentapeptide phosphotransferase/UDP-N-acetylglucosamine-1-phosphate transferase